MPLALCRSCGRAIRADAAICPSCRALTDRGAWQVPQLSPAVIEAVAVAGLALICRWWTG